MKYKTGLCFEPGCFKIKIQFLNSSLNNPCLHWFNFLMLMFRQHIRACGSPLWPLGVSLRPPRLHWICTAAQTQHKGNGLLGVLSTWLMATVTEETQSPPAPVSWTLTVHSDLWSLAAPAAVDCSPTPSFPAGHQRETEWIRRGDAGVHNIRRMMVMQWQTKKAVRV